MRDEVLNCDAPECEHVEKVGVITADMVDMPCPACGSNLLTSEDWVGWKAVSEIMAVVEKIAPDSDGGPKVSMRVGLHGKKTRIEIEQL